MHALWPDNATVMSSTSPGRSRRPHLLTKPEFVLGLVLQHHMQSWTVEHDRMTQTCHMCEFVADTEVICYDKERVAIGCVEMCASVNVRIRGKVADCAVKE